MLSLLKKLNERSEDSIQDSSVGVMSSWGSLFGVSSVDVPKTETFGQKQLRINFMRVLRRMEKYATDPANNESEDYHHEMEQVQLLIGNLVFVNV